MSTGTRRAEGVRRPGEEEPHRRPSGEAPPLPRELGRSGRLFLILLAYVNLRAVLHTPAGQVVSPVAGVRGRLFSRLQRTGHPALVAGVGALFALSFDTMSQATLFALTASQFGGWQHGLALGLAFMGGMLLCDGLNGYWIAHLLKRADRAAAIASRVMGMSIAVIALVVASFGLVKYVSPAVDAWAEGTELAFGLLVTVVVLASFAGALRLAGAALPSAGSRFPS